MTHVNVYLVILLMISGSTYGQEMEDHLWKNRVVVIHGTSEDDEQVRSQVALMEADEAAMKDLKLVLYVKKDSLFKVALYGLDGGLKFTSDALVPMEKFYEIINSMPMRKAELRKRNRG